MPFLVIVEFHGLDLPSQAKFIGQPYEPRAGTVFELPTTELRVGRRQENDLVLPCASVSGFHLRLFPEGDHYFYEDVGSRRPPIFNGESILSRSRMAMKDGDTFNAAGVFFRYMESFPTDLVGE
jgi:pSer/pThr/pTyr-binding forkhead associated (FHA) protein